MSVLQCIDLENELHKCVLSDLLTAGQEYVHRKH